jgi:hypothetical protein
MNQHIIKFFQGFYYFIRLRTKYYPKHPDIRQPYNVCSSHNVRETKFHTYTKQQINKIPLHNKGRFHLQNYEGVS